jgi:hypothetical protein
MVQTWCTLQAHYWEHLAQYWHERARTAEEASADITLVTAVAREALQTLVRRVLDALDASGAPNPSVREVCHELLKELEAVPWDALVDEAAHARAARRAGGDDADSPGGPRWKKMNRILEAAVAPERVARWQETRDRLLGYGVKPLSPGALLHAIGELVDTLSTL